MVAVDTWDLAVRLRRIACALAALLAATVTISGFSGSVAAHAVLLETQPENAAILDDPPERLVLIFNEPVKPLAVRVLDAGGMEVTGPEAARAVDSRIEIALSSPLARGGYIVSWRVSSTDSHIIGGSYLFAVGNAPDHWREAGETQTARAGADGWWSLATGLIRIPFLASLFIAAGSVWFLALISPAPRPSQAALLRPARIAGVTAIGSGLLLIAVQGGAVLTPALSGLADPQVWRASLATPLGMSALAAVAALAAMQLGLHLWDRRFGPGLASLAALAATVSLTLTGHAVVAEPRVLSTPALGVHAVAVAFWLGALVPLHAMARSEPLPKLAAVLQKFSGLAVVVVAVLAVAGLILAAVQVAHPLALVTTPYGGLLLAKVALVVALLAIALANKRRHLPALLSGNEGARARLRRNVRWEAAIILAVIAFTAGLGQTTPPRALAQQEGAAPNRTGSAIKLASGSGDYRASITIDPARPGRNEVTVSIRDSDGNALQPLSAQLRLHHPALSLETGQRAMERRPDGRFVLDGSGLSVPGVWRIGVEVLVTEFENVRFNETIEIE